MSIINLFESLSDDKEKLEFMKAQHDQIVKLTTEKNLLTDKVEHLEKLLQQTTPVLAVQKTPATTSGIISQIEDEEAIARVELRKLRDVTMERALTLEETRKVDIYSKILNTLKNIPKTIEVKAKNYESSELVALLESNNEQAE